MGACSLILCSPDGEGLKFCFVFFLSTCFFHMLLLMGPLLCSSSASVFQNDGITGIWQAPHPFLMGSLNTIPSFSMKVIYLITEFLLIKTEFLPQIELQIVYSEPNRSEYVLETQNLFTLTYMWHYVVSSYINFYSHKQNKVINWGIFKCIARKIK